MPRRQLLRRRHRQSPLVVALYLNAALLACVLVAVLSRGSGSAAFAAVPGVQPIAGGNGLYLMPGQMAINIWGCYVMDVDRQTLCAYEYIPSRKQLQLVASRYVAYDRQLMEYNTTPSPDQIRQLVDLQNAPVRGQGGNVPPAIGPGVEEPKPQGPATQPGDRPLDRPPQPGDKDFEPTPRDIKTPG
jgi:hypothetical protein